MEKELEKNLDQELGAELETVEAPKKPSFLRKLRNHRGFSLVEMAIVLVIIGIIIAAIVKGQDLILNANAKKVTAAVSSWRNLSLAFLDRNGRLPGDSGKSGIIGDTELAAGTSAIDDIVTTMTFPPENPINIGGLTFYVYFGNVPATVGTRNAIVICKDVACATALTPEEIEYMKAIDTALDGSADGGVGQFRAISAALASPADISAVLAAVNGRANRVIRTATTPDVTAGGTPLLWGSAAQYGAIWAFDRPY